jgi:hypothetical protein
VSGPKITVRPGKLTPDRANPTYGQKNFERPEEVSPAPRARRNRSVTERDSVGARPSPGAEILKDSAVSGFTGCGMSSDIAAPGDGRAPSLTHCRARHRFAVAGGREVG